jgi:hypothetical protein
MVKRQVTGEKRELTVGEYRAAMMREVVYVRTELAGIKDALNALAEAFASKDGKHRVYMRWDSD